MENLSDLNLKDNILLLTNVFENFWENCFKIYDLDPVHFYYAPGLASFEASKMPKIVSELLSNIAILLMLEKRIRSEKLIANVLKIMMKINIFHFLCV